MTTSDKANDTIEKDKCIGKLIGDLLDMATANRVKYQYRAMANDHVIDMKTTIIQQTIRTTKCFFQLMQTTFAKPFFSVPLLKHA